MKSEKSDSNTGLFDLEEGREVKVGLKMDWEEENQGLNSQEYNHL